MTCRGINSYSMRSIKKIYTKSCQKCERCKEILSEGLKSDCLEDSRKIKNVLKNPALHFNRSSRRKRGNGVQPTFHNTRLFLHFPNELYYGYLRFEGNGKIPLGR